MERKATEEGQGKQAIEPVSRHARGHHVAAMYVQHVVSQGTWAAIQEAKGDGNLWRCALRLALQIKDFVLSRDEAYEFEWKQQKWRRPGDPPLDPPKADPKPAKPKRAKKAKVCPPT
jgi:hypothetical protein